MLSFVFPAMLSKIGAIPLTTAHSLATKTIRDRRGEIVNNFSAYKHPTVFEDVDLSEQEKAAPIQKIVSSPMVTEGKVVGVIQVSRKGRGGDVIGPDFTPRDLAELNAVGTILGQYLAALPFAAPGAPKPPAPPAKA
jgi:GAF domain-containing protein